MTPSCKSSNSVRHMDTDGQTAAVGLRNLGNTCYFNAVMQSLLRANLLIEELQHPHQQNQFQQQQLQQSVNLLTEAFLSFAKSGYRDGSKEVLRQLLDAFQRQSTRFSGGRQQDSHDCLIHFLNDLRDEERRLSSAPDPRKTLTAVDKVFGGHLLTTYICLSCDDQYRCCEPLITISLPIVSSKEKNSLDDICKGKQEKKRKIEAATRRLALTPMKNSRKFHFSKTSVSRCFTHFTRREEIRKEYLCQKCQMKERGSSCGGGDDPLFLTSAIKQTLVYNPPAVLVLHIKRFEQIERGFRKRSDRIRYKELLDLGPFCTSNCLRISPKDQHVWYSLFAVIVHKGSLTRGHYVAYVKDGVTSERRDQKTFLQANYLDRDADTTEQQERVEERGEQGGRVDPPNPPMGQWFYVNDKTVQSLNSAKEALKQEAYLLFYERIGTPLKTTEEKKLSTIVTPF